MAANFRSRNVVRLEGRVDGVEREIQEEGLRLVGLDEGDRLAPERIGQVVLLIDRRRPTQDGSAVGAGKVRVRAAEEPEEGVETPLRRMEAIRGPEMPFADRAGRVTGRAHAVREGRLGEREPMDIVLVRKVELVPEALLIATGHETRARRRTIRSAHVGIREADAVRGDAVDVGGRNVLAAVDADVRVPHVVAEDHDHVRRPRRSGGQRRHRRRKYRHDTDDTHATCEY